MSASSKMTFGDFPPSSSVTRLIVADAPASVDEIVRRADLAASQVAAAVAELELLGVIVQAEGRVPAAVVEGLRAAGYAVNRRPQNYDWYFANAQLIVVDADGTLRGASDPRKDGGAAYST